MRPFIPITIPEAWQGYPYREVRRQLTEHDVIPLALRQGETAPTLNPEGDTTLQMGDVVFYMSNWPLENQILHHGPAAPALPAPV